MVTTSGHGRRLRAPYLCQASAGGRYRFSHPRTRDAEVVKAVPPVAVVHLPFQLETSVFGLKALSARQRARIVYPHRCDGGVSRGLATHHRTVCKLLIRNRNGSSEPLVVNAMGRLYSRVKL